MGNSLQRRSASFTTASLTPERRKNVSPPMLLKKLFKFKLPSQTILKRSLLA